jgi:hypothetical protein
VRHGGEGVAGKMRHGREIVVSPEGTSVTAARRDHLSVFLDCYSLAPTIAFAFVRVSIA